MCVRLALSPPLATVTDNHDDMLTKLLAQLQDLVVKLNENKKILSELTRDKIKKWDPVLVHDLIHISLHQVVIPDKYADESDFDYETRLLQLRRLCQSEIRTTDCLIGMFDLVK